MGTEDPETTETAEDEGDELTPSPVADDLEHGYILARRDRLRTGALVAIYAGLAGAAAGLLSPRSREILNPIFLLPVVIAGVANSHRLATRTTGTTRKIWTAQRAAMIAMIPATIIFSVAGMTGSKIWLAIATAFGAGAGGCFVRQFSVAVRYYQGHGRGLFELLDMVTVIICGLALVGYVLIVPLIIAGVEHNVPFALLPPLAIGFLFGFLLLAFASPTGRKTTEYIFAGAGLFALVMGVLESLAALNRFGGQSTAWLRGGMWGLSLGLIAIAPLWAPAQHEGDDAEYRGSWQAPRFFLPYWSLLVLPLLSILALAGDRPWGPAYAFVSTFIVFGIVIARQLVTIRENRFLFSEIVRREADRNQLLARTIQAAEEERKRLARDLHDGPVQDLSALMLRMGRAAERSTTAPEMLLADLRDRLSAQVQSIRETIAVLRPPLLDKAGLARALAVEVENSFARETTAVEIDIEEVTGLTSDQELQLFRIAQEAIRNARLHARADKVAVRLGQAAGGTVTLEVKDSGVGFVLFRSSHPAARGHVGLASMRERATLAGADIEIVSTPGAGTLVRATLAP